VTTIAFNDIGNSLHTGNHRYKKLEHPKRYAIVLMRMNRVRTIRKRRLMMVLNPLHEVRKICLYQNPEFSNGPCTHKNSCEQSGYEENNLKDPDPCIEQSDS
jgi:hypothetical protein